MKFQELREEVCEEIRLVLSKVEENEVEAFIDHILKANRLFFIGVGRVMLMLQAFAKRLKHLGLDSYVVGETTVPGIQKGDLLVAGSGSGETLTTLNVARLAKKHQAKVALITSSPNSALKELSDLSVRIPAPTKVHLLGEISSKQPMTNLFEQSLLIFCDGVSMIIQDKLNVSEEEMWKIHVNLE
jgi:6-phospho-3-hexuloisomerase